jgi:hypothetical protein
MGQIIDNVDPFSFQVIDDTYAEDYQHVFRYGRIIEGFRPRCCQPSTTCNSESMIMQSMNSMYTMQTDAHMCMPMSSVPTQMSSYEVRDFKVFFGSQLLPDARWIDFTNLGLGYGMLSSLPLKFSYYIIFILSRKRCSSRLFYGSHY